MREALAADAVLEVLLAADASASAIAEARAAVARGVTVHEVDARAMSALSSTVTPQGIVAVARTVTRDFDQVLPASETVRLVAVLAGVSDPGNAGTVIRVADAVGCDAVVLTEGSVDVHNPKCVRASTGSIFHLRIATGAVEGDCLARMRAAGLVVVAADARGPEDLDAALDRGLLGGPTAWVFGNEAHGLDPDVVDAADAVVRIPVYGRAESLNLATAAAVCLYATARAQRRPAGRP